MRFVYALINFILLFGIVWFFGRKTIKGIFEGRAERIKHDLDELEEPLPELPRLPEEQEAPPEDSACVRERSQLEEDLKDLEEDLRKDRESLRRDMLCDLRAEIVKKMTARAAEDMTGEEFRSRLSEQEDLVADKIIRCIRLTPGDISYIAQKGILYVTLMSPEPLKESTVERIHTAVDELLDKVGAKASFWVKDHEAELLGGFRLRIGDTIYDYSVQGRLYRMQEALNDMPMTGSDEESVLASVRDALGRIRITVDVFQLGRVLTVSDGICWMDGLSGIMYGELVEFTEADNPMYGMVMDVQKDKIGCVIFGRYEHVDAYSRVRRMGRMAETPVGEELLGRVVNPMGEPIDGKGRIWTRKTRPIECAAPAILDRQPVRVPLETGIKAVDSMVPIGRGQRELIIGDRQTGKSAIAVDTILNQKGKGVYCIYVAIGQKETTVASIVSKLEQYGAMDYTTVVCSSASDPASVQYIAPFVGCAMAEYYMYEGKDALVIYDDLSKHAVAYREISLLLHRPSGREAYPGDIFYLHSRLLERAARLSEEAGGGSVTALPLIETQAGDISAYIPTNVISITDGQIFLETGLFNEGQRPAVNVGLSVSRVGGSAQTKLMKQVASNLRTSLAQYREYASFAQFGAEVDDATRRTLENGENMMALLRQERYHPMPTWEQALLIYAVGKGAAQNYGKERMASFEADFLAYMRHSHPDICAELQKGDRMTQEFRDGLDLCIGDFTKEQAHG